MSDRPLLVLTFEGLATSAIGCYGSPWNNTPAIDTIAAGGCVWDRWIATNDDPLKQVRQWLAAESTTDDWASSWRQQGPTQLITDDRRLIAPETDSDFSGSSSCFDGSSLILRDDELPGPATEIEETQLGRLIIAAIKRDELGPWSMMWLHSRFLSHRWDAPRELFPVDMDEAAMAEIDIELADTEFDASDPTAETIGSIPCPPLIFDDVVAPQIALGSDSHPDLVTSWMRTYGCQVRLIDLLIEVLLQSIDADDPLVVVAGTSGMSLGQNGWIGHGIGPLRSCDLRLPMIVSDHGPIRSSLVTGADRFPAVLRSLADESEQILSPSGWCDTDDELEPRVVTDSVRAAESVTTSRWQFVRDNDASDHLFLKPDDVEDANDVGRLRSDIVEQISSGETS